MKKREKKLRIAKETLLDLEEAKQMREAKGAADLVDGSCTSGASTAGGTRKVCC